MNAKQELLELCKNYKVKLKCAVVEEIYYMLENKRRFVLPVGYTPKQLKSFLANLDFEYDDGYGSEYLGGTLWFKDGTWAIRGEYDGSEWWDYNKLPSIPKEATGVLSDDPSRAKTEPKRELAPKRKDGQDEAR